MAIKQMALENGGMPCDEDVRVHLQRRFGTRGGALAMKGWVDRGNQNRFADEELVVCSVLTAIKTGREVVVITFDNDIFDQFSKLVHLVSDDYWSMLVAERYAEDPRSCAPCHLPDNLIGFKLPYWEMWDLIRPGPFTNAYCILLGNNFQQLRQSFSQINIPLDVARLLRVKAESGKNTDQLGGRNCRVSIGESCRKSVVAVAIISFEQKLRVDHNIYYADDLWAALREDDVTVFPSIVGHDDSEIARDREILLAGNPGDPLHMSPRAVSHLQRQRQQRHKKSQREFCQPIAELF
ncbi:MAG: hypothetical protein R3C10_06700 [Pirellulales bacterium]